MYGIKSRWVAPYRKELLKRQKKMEKMGIEHKLKRSEYIEWYVNFVVIGISSHFPFFFFDNPSVDRSNLGFEGVLQMYSLLRCLY